MYSVFNQSRFYVGKVPVMIIADVDMVKEILIQLNDQFPDREVSSHSERAAPCIECTPIKHVTITGLIH